MGVKDTIVKIDLTTMEAGEAGGEAVPYKEQTLRLLTLAIQAGVVPGLGLSGDKVFEMEGLPSPGAEGFNESCSRVIATVGWDGRLQTTPYYEEAMAKWKMTDLMSSVRLRLRSAAREGAELQRRLLHCYGT